MPSFNLGCEAPRHRQASCPSGFGGEILKSGVCKQFWCRRTAWATPSRFGKNLQKGFPWISYKKPGFPIVNHVRLPSYNQVAWWSGNLCTVWCLPWPICSHIPQHSAAAQGQMFMDRMGKSPCHMPILSQLFPMISHFHKYPCTFMGRNGNKGKHVMGGQMSPGCPGQQVTGRHGGKTNMTAATRNTTRSQGRNHG